MTKAAVTQRGKSTKKISPKVIHEVHKFMKALFNQAVEWEMLEKNPCKKVNSTIPEYEQGKRPSWTRNQFLEAARLAEKMEDLTLCVAMYLSVSTSLREGEICGLQWDRVFISNEDIALGDCRVYVDREMARVDKEAMNTLDRKDILYEFPNILGHSKSSMVLKKPKTKGSVRVVWVAATAARMLQKLKDQQDKRRDFLGMAYRDYGLVMTPGDGRPFEGSKLNNRLQSLIKKHDLFRVTFHSFRHTSTSYKLRISHGDIKSVQGDTGHGSSQMVTETYAEIIDEDRKYNAQHFESHFFQTDSPTEMNQKEEQARKRDSELSTNEMMSFMTFMQSNPEFVRQVLANNGATATSR